MQSFVALECEEMFEPLQLDYWILAYNIQKEMNVTAGEKTLYFECNTFWVLDPIPIIAAI